MLLVQNKVFILIKQLQAEACQPGYAMVKEI